MKTLAISILTLTLCATGSAWAATSSQNERNAQVKTTPTVTAEPHGRYNSGSVTNNNNRLDSSDTDRNSRMNGDNPTGSFNDDPTGNPGVNSGMNSGSTTRKTGPDSSSGLQGGVR